MARRRQPLLSPTDITIQPTARPRAQYQSAGKIAKPDIRDPRAQAEMQLAQAMKGKSAAISDFANQTAQAGNQIAGAYGELGRRARFDASIAAGERRLKAGDIEQNAAALGQKALAAQRKAQDIQQTTQTFQNVGKLVGTVAEVFQGFEDRRAEADDKAWLSTAKIKSALQLDSLMYEHRNSGTQGRDFVYEGDNKLVKEFGAIEKDINGQLGYSLSEKGKERWAEWQASTRAQYASENAREANNARVKRLEGTQESNQFDIEQMAYASGDLEAGVKASVENAQILQNVVYDDELAAKIRAGVTGVTGAVISGHIDRAKKTGDSQELDKADAILGQFTGYPGPNTNVVTAAIAEEGKKAGVSDQHALLGIAWIESRLDPGAANPDSTARGLFQFIKTTGMSYGLPPDASAASVKEQARAGAEWTARNEEVLRRAIGDNPTPGQLYLAHFLDAPVAVRVIQADPNTPAKDIIGTKALAANRLPKDMTTGELQVWADKKMQEAMGAVMKDGLWAGRVFAPNQSSIPIESVARLGAKIEKARDDLVSINAIQIGDKMQTMQNADIDVMISSYEPKPDATERQKKLYEQVSKQGAAIMKMRRDDPALAVSLFPSVRDAREKARSGKPEDIQAAVGATLKAQEGLGIPAYARKPITVEAAKELAMPIVSASRVTGRSDVSVDERAAVETVVKGIITNYGPYADEVLPHVIEQTTKDRQMGPVATSLFRKIVKGQSLTKSDLFKAGVSSDAGNASSALPPLQWEEYNKEMGIAAQAKWPTAPLSAITALRQHPEMANEFDRKYGPGAANRVIKAKVE